MDSKQFHARLYGVTVIMAALFLLFFGVLYNLQIVNGATYRERSAKRIARVETVEASRGELLDCNGRVLVSNRATYQVTLDVSMLGTPKERNATLLQLLEVCRREGVVWADTLPISRSAPYVYTLGESSAPARRNFAQLVEAMNWSKAAAPGLAQLEQMDPGMGEGTDTPADAAPAGVFQSVRDWSGKAAASAVRPGTAAPADALLDAMGNFFELEDTLSPQEVRDVVGVLYELRLRSRDISRTAYIFAQDVDIRFITAVKELGLKGVKIEATTVRQYETTYLAHILGRVGPIDAEGWEAYYRDAGYDMDDTVGRDGLELAFEDYLRGVAGERIVETNANGKVVSETWRVDSQTGEILAPQPGNHVVTTVDQRLQEVLERSLAARVPSLSEEVKGAAGVVIDMKGGVKAMASYPTFDLTRLYTDTAYYNEVSQDPLSPLLNRATHGLYSPGSTFKMIVGVAALQEGLTTPEERIQDTGRFQYPKGEKYPYGDYHPACWYYLQYRGNHGRVTVGEAIKDSCNIFFFTLGDRLGIDLIDDYAARFGLGRPTGIEIGEKTGMVAGPETSQRLNQTWYGGNLLSAAIGQGNTLCTPLQLANYIAALVNGGDRYPAHLLKAVKSSDYSRVLLEYEPQPLDSINISPENLEAVKEGMYLMANEGSVRNYFKDLPVTVGAKTGTAQVGSETANSNAIFVCFAPYEDPEIAIALVAEQGGSGTDLAAVAADVLSVYFSEEQVEQSVTGEGQLLH